MFYPIFHYFLLVANVFLFSTKPKIVEPTTFKHFFVYDTESIPSKDHYQYGESVLTSDNLEIGRNMDTESQWLDCIKEAYDALPENKKGIIFYIHGYQADKQFFVRSSGQIIQKEIFDVPSHEYGMAVSLIWKSVLGYDDAVANAYKKGQYFAEIVERIQKIQQNNCPQAKISVMAHSMGNRVWEGLFQNWVTAQPTLKLSTVMLLAADLEDTVFNNTLSTLPDHAARIIVYHNHDDVTLSFANKFREHRRLGIYGPENPISLPKNIIVKDVTGIADEDIKNGTFTKHRYYYTSPSVRKALVGFLSM
ncbi:MAG: alpha/beta hydrolase [Saprospiraceae bacterium]